MNISHWELSVPSNDNLDHHTIGRLVAKPIAKSVKCHPPVNDP
jgi:hypothetical protein